MLLITLSRLVKTMSNVPEEEIDTICPYAGTEECDHCMYFADPCFDWLFDDDEEIEE